MPYRLSSADPDMDKVRSFTAVLFNADGYCVAQVDDPTLSVGDPLPDEHPLLDASLRIPLATHGFRPQRVHTVAVADAADAAELADEPEGLHWYCFVQGYPYGGGRRPAAKVPLRTYRPEELADRFERAGATEWARLVRDAARSFREQDDASRLADDLRHLEPAYLRATTPHGQSGVGGTAQDWRRSREPVVDGLRGDGDFLDLGCANGHLMESVRQWAAERGIAIEPYGMDAGSRLVELARTRLPAWADRLWVGNALEWEPPDGRRFDHVHLRLDVAAPARRAAFLRHVTERMLRPGGRLIVTYHEPGAEHAWDAASALRSLGYVVAGSSGPSGQEGQVAWTDPDS